MVALITVEVHNRDIVEQLWDAAVMSTEDFIWQQQLRYYFQTKEKEANQEQAKEGVIVK